LSSRTGSGSATTQLPGVNKVWRPLVGGRVARLWYAWRGKGAPLIARFEGANRGEVLAQERSIEGAKKVADGYAQATHHTIDTSTLAGILDAWEASDHFRRRSDSTKIRERGSVEMIRQSAIGAMPVRLLAALSAKREIRSWLAEVARKTPRAADTRKDILSKALNWAIAEGLCTVNPVQGIADFAFADRSDIIWLKCDLEAFEAAARAARRKLLEPGAPEPNERPALVFALLVACYTGLRREDLCNLTWRDIGNRAITVRPLKSMRRRKTAGKKAPSVVVIPRTPELDAVLAEIRPGGEEKAQWVLTNSRGKQWTPSGLTSSFIKIRDAAGIAQEPAPGSKDPPVAKTLHDARGTFVTHMRMMGFAKEQVAEMVGWETADVDRVAKRYADAERIAAAWLEQLGQRELVD
jgi:integrase